MEIIKLIEKLKAGTILPEELERLKRLMEDPKVSKELLSSFRESFDRLTDPDLKNLPPYPHKQKGKERLLRSIQGPAIPEVRKRFLSKISIGVSIAALLAVVGFLFLYKPAEPELSEIEWAEVQTSYGEKKKINLYDGSTVVMNGNSSVCYSKSVLDSVRLIKLEGEAYFDVVPNDQKPFYVITDKFITQVVGTSFNIDSKIDRLIEVTSGVVNVLAVDKKETTPILGQPSALKSNLQALIIDNNSRVTELSKGQSAHLSGQTWDVSAIEKNNWHNNVLMCLNEPLQKIAEKAYRFYGDSIYVDPALSEKKLSITFNDTPIQLVAETLSELSDGQLEYDDKNKIWRIMKK